MLHHWDAVGAEYLLCTIATLLVRSTCFAPLRRCLCGVLLLCTIETPFWCGVLALHHWDAVGAEYLLCTIDSCFACTCRGTLSVLKISVPVCVCVCVLCVCVCVCVPKVCLVCVLICVCLLVCVLVCVRLVCVQICVCLSVCARVDCVTCENACLLAGTITAACAKEEASQPWWLILLRRRRRRRKQVRISQVHICQVRICQVRICQVHICQAPWCCKTVYSQQWTGQRVQYSMYTGLCNGTVIAILHLNNGAVDWLCLTVIAPSLHRHCTVIAPSLHRHCTVTAPSLHRHCTVTAPRHWTVIAPSLHRHYTIIAPSLHRHCTVTAPSLHRHCTVIAPSLHSPVWMYTIMCSVLIMIKLERRKKSEKRAHSARTSPEISELLRLVIATYLGKRA